MILGITGKIATGKSCASTFFENQGFNCIHVDQLGHVLLESVDSPVLPALRQFLPEIFQNGELLSRKEIGEFVFRNHNQLKTLNAVMHPFMVDMAVRRIKSAPEKNWILDAALLFQMDLHKVCDKILLIKARKESCLQRTTCQPETFNLIWEIQAHLDAYEDQAHHVIWNDHSIERFHKDLTDFYNLVNV